MVAPAMILFASPNEGESLDKSAFIPILCVHCSFYRDFEKIDIEII